MEGSNSEPLRPLLLEVLGEVLKSEVHGTSSTYKSVTLSQGSAVPSDALARMRAEAIELLMDFTERRRPRPTRRLTEAALFEATRHASRQAFERAAGRHS